jgi:hypothetical protein
VSPAQLLYCDAQVRLSADDSQDEQVVVLVTHVPAEQVVPLVQAFPQKPQSVFDVWRFWQPSVQLVSVPHAFARVQVPLTQVSPLGQTFPHSPQLMAELLRLTHDPLQFVYGAVQVFGSGLQTPSAQEYPAPQLWLQEPQFVFDEVRSTQSPLQLVPVEQPCTPVTDVVSDDTVMRSM